MKKNELSDRKLKILIVLAVLVIGWLCFKGATAAHAQAASGTLSPGVQEVVKLTQAHMGDDVILAYIHNSGASYNLSADDILYLNSQGVSQPVISALLQAKGPAGPPPSAPVVSNPAPPPSYPAPDAAPQVVPPGGVPPEQSYAAPSTPPPSVGEAPTGSDVTLGYFQNQLAPYGQWVSVPDYGQCWVPTVESQVPDWRPYLNGGHWEYTENGWFWASDYPWGEYVFHYGRWARVAPYGWVWVPGYHWGPAWVSWRNADASGYCGWAPLPPGARFDPGVGIIWNGSVAVDTDFGLAPDMYVFVPFDHFWVHDYGLWVAPPWRASGLFRGSVVLNGYGFVGGRFMINGIGRDRIAFLTHHDVPFFSIGFRDSHIAHDRAGDFDRGRGGRGFRDEHRGW